jgi:hypothetical protein
MIPYTAYIVLWIFITVVVILILIRTGNHYHRFTYFYQYLFFCRYPILFGLLLFGLPFLILGPAKNILGNLVELDPWGIGVAAFMTIYTSWIILFNLTRILEISPIKAQLNYMRGHNSCTDSSGKTALADLSFRLWLLCHLGNVVLDEKKHAMRRLIYFAVLGIPLLLLIIYSSSQVDGDLRIHLVIWNTVSTLIGIAIALILRWSFIFLQKHLDWYATPFFRPFIWLAEIILRHLFRIKNKVAESIRNKLAQGIIFAIISFLIYCIGYVLTLPELTDIAYGLIPSIGLILMIVWLCCFGFSLLAVSLDTYRIPVMTLTLIGVVLLYIVLQTDYTYELKSQSLQNISQMEAADDELRNKAITPADAVIAWRKGRGAEARVMVVVAASGGGITAAQWTAEVLTRLHEELFPAFGNALVLMSTTSGGSTGAMYFTDRFPALMPDLKDEDAYDSVRQAASNSSLNAAVHGLIYGDILRFIPGLHALLRDRGNALEDVWQSRLADSEATIMDWKYDVALGKRPVHIFNSTIAETGDLFFISPLHHTDRYQNFLDLYPYCNLGVATAARLSATFPFVSPQARPGRFVVKKNEAFHLADGGYFDNQGLLGAITFIDEAYQGVEERKGLPFDLPERVLLIQIRAFETEQKKAEPDKGWKYEFLGPVITVMNMRSAAQQTRGALEEEFLIRLQKASRDVEVITIPFSLKRDKAPLSWHLTKGNREDIQCAWNDQKEPYDHVRNFLGAGSEFVPIQKCSTKIK